MRLYLKLDDQIFAVNVALQLSSTNIYMFKVNKRNIEKGVKYVQSLQ